jgi:pyruvate,water dikinase
MIAALHDLRHRDAENFGGKAAVLGTMISAGFQVPKGIAVSVRHYATALDESEGDPRRLNANDLAKTIFDRFPWLSQQPRLIARSSATVEDSTALSYAGQFVSTQCKADVSNLARAIKDVWASCTAPNVREYRDAYRRRHGNLPDNHSDVQMGVVVQSHLNFEMAGLLFTQHPTVAVRNWMLCEYLNALPDEIVGGEVTPHRCRIAVSSGKAVWERRVPGAPVLSADSLGLLVNGGHGLRELMGVDVDIEWGLHGATLSFLQCRPATVSPSEINMVEAS